MSAIARHLARDVHVRTSHRVDTLERRGNAFFLSGTIGEPGVTLGPREPASEAPLADFGAFDVCIVCLPSDQAHPLVSHVAPSLAERAARIACEPCLALGFASQDIALSKHPFDGIFVGRDGDPERILSWLVRDSSKPQRPGRETWMLHASPSWSPAHLRAPRETIEQAMLGEFARLLNLSPVQPTATILRRWAFARAPSEQPSEALFDDAMRLGVGGDWSAGGRVEGAFLSGVALAGRVLGLPNDNGTRPRL